MDKPSQTKPYAGLVIYRTQRNIEYLLINDSFSNKKHWFCPKGPIIGNEEDIKCALRETFETTGLKPSELHIEEGFAIELKYLSGTKPKKVKYYLAELINNHVRLLPHAEGVHFQWFNQVATSEKVIFKTMQEVFKHAQTFIETKQRKKKSIAHATSSVINTAAATKTTTTNNNRTTTQSNGIDQVRSGMKSLSINNKEHNKSNYKSHNQQQQPSLSPLYKTRLCERFELEGSCPYGTKCNFAHGVNELRGRTDLQQQSNLQKEDRNEMFENQLFKTKLCEKYMRDKFCQYGPKCHFAHGEEELKTRPNKKTLEEEIIDSRQSYSNRHLDTPHHNSSFDQWNKNEANKSNDAPWKSQTMDKSSSNNKVSHQESRADRKTSWRNSISKTVNNPEDLPRPTSFIDHHKSLINGKEKHNKHCIQETNEKSWMKIVQLSKEEQDELLERIKIHSHPLKENNNQQQATTKSAQTEAIISDLKSFFAMHPTTTTLLNGKLAEDIKEVTKIEMRNDLSKKRLLYILLVSLLEEDNQQHSILTVLKSRSHLFKSFVKSNTDQLLLLKAWDNLVTNRKPILVNRTAAALSYWYDSEMIEEDVFLEWYNTLEKGSLIEQKCVKFIEWLNEPDNSE
ncbi:uncharacterized protein BX663DRAFT_76035 [Cokeromyces recurvatus]|uniref:uncharacterized protein n=1 Tax=Cokeromyces recurvatus TaxID=90255 RepID=UPI00221FE3A1|nr:uncharacterized protein BX663DRAFT_76035 [Cokeromyces recurvatus]KAI7902453.1 hypothetical protein BX663DRAFT_76035 [Cokeromyces recurvatus]